MNISQNLLQPWNVRAKRPKIVIFFWWKPAMIFSIPPYFSGDVAARASQILFGNIQTDFLCFPKWLNKNPSFFGMGTIRKLIKTQKTSQDTHQNHPSIPTLGRCVFQNPAKNIFQIKGYLPSIMTSKPGTPTFPSKIMTAWRVPLQCRIRLQQHGFNPSEKY